MPFFGLVNSQGEEISGGGYHRIDASEITFKISPARGGNADFVFVNTSVIMWPKAIETWPELAGFCVFAEVDDEQPIIVRQFSTGAPKQLRPGDILAIAAGQFSIDHTISSNVDRSPGPQRCPKCGHEYWSHEQ